MHDLACLFSSLVLHWMMIDLSLSHQALMLILGCDIVLIHAVGREENQSENVIQGRLEVCWVSTII